MPLDDPRGQLPPHAEERAVADPVLEPRQRRLRSQRLARPRVPAEQQLVDRVVGEAVRIVAVRMPAGDAEDPLADQVRQRVPDLLRRAGIGQTPGQRLEQAVHALGRLEQDRPAVGTRLFLVEPGVQRLVEQIREQNSLWYRVGRHAGASVMVKMPVVTAILPRGGPCVSPGAAPSVNNPGYSVCLPSLACDFFKLTETEGSGTGESLAQFPIRAGDHVLADRGYSTARGIRHVVEAGGKLIVRVNTGSLPLRTATGKQFDLLAAVESVTRSGDAWSWATTVVSGEDTDGPAREIPGRVCAIRKSAAAIREAHRRIRRDASRKGNRVQPATLRFAEYVIVFTTFPEPPLSWVTGSGEKIHERVCRYGDHVPIREVWRARTMTGAVRRGPDLNGTPGTCASNTSNEKRRS